MIKLGIDKLLDEEDRLIRGRRVGVLTNAAGVSRQGHTAARIIASGLCDVRALFGPEHGMGAIAEDMEAVGHGREKNLPVYSLYGSTLDSLKPTRRMLSEIDVLVVDLQDIGSRYYTYVWTACLAMEACEEEGKEIIVCDRPNPIGGIKIEGGEIEEGYESFVGLHSIPVRHGMTIGEIVSFVGNSQKIGKVLKVVKMTGWRREMSWPEFEMGWVSPSPNMRSYSAALLYPGMCLLEATNMSEGRGTDTPFEIVGAPYVNSEKLIREFEKLRLPGIKAAPTAFIPTKQKWRGKYCNGVRWVITDASKFEPYLTGLAFVWLIYRLYNGEGFAWRAEPYEFVINRPAIDLLTGSHSFFERIERMSLKEIRDMATTPKASLKIRKNFLIY